MVATGMTIIAPLVYLNILCLNMYYNTDKIYVISLKHRQHRLTHFFHTIPSDIFNPKKILIYDAVDGSKEKLPDWWLSRCGGTYGCYSSHKNIWQEIVEKNYKNVIIFEDDAIFCENFTRLFSTFMSSIPDDWDQAYIGGQHLEPATRINECVVLGSNINRTHAYMIKNRDSAIKIINNLSDIDLWTTSLKNKMHVDHALGHLHSNKIIKAYASDPFLVGQNIDKFSDTGCRPRMNKAWWNK